MKTKMKKAAKPMMRKRGKVLPKHQTPPGETMAPYKKQSMVASDQEKSYERFGPQNYDNTKRNAISNMLKEEGARGDAWRNLRLEGKGASMRPERSSANPGVEPSLALKRKAKERGWDLSPLFPLYKKKGGSVAGKPMMKKSASTTKSKSSKKK